MQLAIDNGFTIEVICFRFRNWSDEINEGILKRFSEQAVQFHSIEAGREGGTGWLQAALKEKCYRFLSKAIRLRGRALATAVSRRNSSLLAVVKKIQQADWVIGHNPGAMYATKYATQQLKAKAGFDVEDYHPGEGHHLHEQKITRQLMQEVLPAMNYVSFAAPLIREAVKNDLGKEGANWLTVLNYFPAAEFVAPKNIEGPLKLVWFSQNIAAGRGLEYILPVLKNFAGEIELHLYGNVDVSFYENLLCHLENVIVHKPIPQKDLHNFLSYYDIGLALENDGDVNRDLCITNKLLAYLQAGLYVLASDTTAQKDYIRQIIGSGVCINIKSGSEIEKIFDSLIIAKVSLRVGRIARFTDHENNNWDNECVTLLSEWNEQLIENEHNNNK